MREAFISIQKTIEALDRAFQDEKGLAAPQSDPEAQFEEAEVEEGGPLLP
jgi:hypothetical protein